MIGGDSRQDPFSLGLVTTISQGGDEVRSESSLDVGYENPMRTRTYEGWVSVTSGIEYRRLITGRL
jgi:hypothetical protein